MRYFLRRRIPDFDRVLLVESGSRGIAERLLPVLRNNYGEGLKVDLVTCYAGLPGGFTPDTEVFQVADYPGRAGLNRLCAELRARPNSVLGIICSGEPVMTKWKWALAARLPFKVFVANENGDYFWFDYSNWRIIAHITLLRAGLAGPGALRSLARMAVFPFTLAFLLLYAGAVHLRRGVRRAGI